MIGFRGAAERAASGTLTLAAHGRRSGRSSTPLAITTYRG
jgi:hypothetical protein